MAGGATGRPVSEAFGPPSVEVLQTRWDKALSNMAWHWCEPGVGLEISWGFLQPELSHDLFLIRCHVAPGQRAGFSVHGGGEEGWEGSWRGRWVRCTHISHTFTVLRGWCKRGTATSTAPWLCPHLLSARRCQGPTTNVQIAGFNSRRTFWDTSEWRRCKEKKKDKQSWHRSWRKQARLQRLVLQSVQVGLEWVWNSSVRWTRALLLYSAHLQVFASPTQWQAEKKGEEELDWVQRHSNENPNRAAQAEPAHRCLQRGHHPPSSHESRLQRAVDLSVVHPSKAMMSSLTVPPPRSIQGQPTTNFLSELLPEVSGDPMEEKSPRRVPDEHQSYSLATAASLHPPPFFK